MARTCSQHGCGAPAEWLAHWPGVPTWACRAHAERAEGLAEAMGFVLHLEDAAAAEARLEDARNAHLAAARLGWRGGKTP